MANSFIGDPDVAVGAQQHIGPLDVTVQYPLRVGIMGIIRASHVMDGDDPRMKAIPLPPHLISCTMRKSPMNRGGSAVSGGSASS